MNLKSSFRHTRLRQVGMLHVMNFGVKILELRGDVGPVIYGCQLSEVREHLSSRNCTEHVNAKSVVSKPRTKS